ncbi:MAG: thioesterase family protein [Anaerolineales bacterium]|nr:thioesterase family protein [Anaerolineales bacterium]MDW8160497.1 thioesterase family protein [Anaerolineales bacterium]
MEFSGLIQPGLIRVDTYTVEEEHTAKHLGSGSSRVLATPWMILFMERTCHRSLAERLPAGYSSVGIGVNVRHLAPSRVGSTVQVRSEVLRVEGPKVLFAVEVRQGETLIGQGEHERFIIDEQRFLKRVHESK